MCEGPGDKSLFQRLLTLHGLTDKFEVDHPGRSSGGAGRGGFAKYLSGASVSPSFLDNVEVVLIVSDNDDDPAESFKEIVDGLKSEKIFTAPAAERTLVRKAGMKAGIVILMIPMDEIGAVETLCVRAAYANWPLQPSLDAFVAVTPANAWGVTKQSKMRMQTLLAATCATKPDTNLANHWQEDAQYHIPLNHPSFDSIVQFLQAFEDVVAD
jgi:hypothetical protein